MNKDKYEISLWEDYLVQENNNIPAHYEERKLCVIGSNTLTASCRAFEPRMVENINGTNTFTFKMFYSLEEENIELVLYNLMTGQPELDNLLDNELLQLAFRKPELIHGRIQNPFLPFLVNERKIKVLWKNKWYDMIIKNCQEDSSGKFIIYTCTDLFINELSKTGFDIVLDKELENNQGTIGELAQTILDGSDWSLLDTDLIQQFIEEPVYEVTTLIPMLVHNESLNTDITLPANSQILVYYQQIQNFINDSTSKIQSIQFAYSTMYRHDGTNQLVTNADCYSLKNPLRWRKQTISGADCITLGEDNAIWLRIFYHGGISGQYRAKRLVKNQISKLDILTGKYCNVWKAITDDDAKDISKDDEIYSYQTTEWNSALVVNNLIVNNKDFSTTEGWLGNDLIFQLFPRFTPDTDITTYNAKSYLRLSASQNVYNAGARESSSYFPNGFSVGETYIFRYKAQTQSNGGPSGTYATTGIIPIIGTYKDEGSLKILDTTKPTYFSITKLSGSSDNWVEYRLTCTKSITRADIYKEKVGFFLQVETNTRWLEQVELFREVYGENHTRINPGDIDIASVATIKYMYFNHTKTDGLLDVDALTYLWAGTTEWNYTNITPVYNENFEKIRSITAKQSNRFNLLQSLAETFECWLECTINHDSTGRTIYNEDGTPQKYISFKKERGQETGIGFIYGLDLKSISRTIQSDQIVTKTIVSPNNNSFATNGFCTISRSQENYPRSNFILNFDYYISQDLLDGGLLNNDLYDSTGDVAYYYNLNKYNTEYDNLMETYGAKRIELEKQLSYQNVYENTVSALQQSIQDLKSELIALSGVDTWEKAQKYIGENIDSKEINTRMVVLKTQESNLSVYQTMLTSINNSIRALQDLIDSMDNRMDELLVLIREKNFAFYKKYSRFIQEGSWISEDYIDDNLYYLDAQSIAYTSSRPKISYNISVVRLSSLDEFKNKIFKLGDIAFIQDTEFFGYTYVNQIKTPYKEKVLVSEIVSYFDEPQKDTITVQNYKTQFEDLFQRITSATQSLQYASGEYARAAEAIETDGTINPETLQNSIALNEQLVYSAQNEAIIQDATGLTVTDTTNPNKKTKLTSGGIFITTDGGATWKNAVRGEGIATQYLTTGSINANNINIMDGNFTTFRWDSQGINAYQILPTGFGINMSKFVRFDHFGVYGINNDTSQKYTPEKEDDIWRDAQFGLTWSGFFMKNHDDSGFVEVSSKNDFSVKQIKNGQEIERVKIGRLDGSIGNYIYGLRISDGNGTSVMETDSNGELWLKKRLSISSSQNQHFIGIGYLDAVTTDKEIQINYLSVPLNLDTRGFRRTIDVDNKFVVWEDGTLYSTGGYFSGTINATGGRIGNVTIDEVVDSAYKVEITTDKGTIFKPGAVETIKMTARLMLGAQEVTTGTKTYTWFKNSVQVGTGNTYTATMTSVQDIANYVCEIDYQI